MFMFVRQNHRGFTLIEVLIALAILSIALTAIIQSTSQHIRDTTYIQNKTIANWVGTQVMNELRTGILKFPQTSSTMEQQMEMLGRTWVWKAHGVATPNKNIQEIDVEVFEKTNHSKLITLVGYLYAS